MDQGLAFGGEGLAWDLGGSVDGEGFARGLGVDVEGEGRTGGLGMDVEVDSGAIHSAMPKSKVSRKYIKPSSGSEIGLKYLKMLALGTSNSMKR